jgi:hypothetical protein
MAESSPEERCAFHFDAYDACNNFVGYVNRHDWPFRAPFFFGPPLPVYTPQDDFYGQQLPNEIEEEDEQYEEAPEGELQERKIFIGGLPYDVSDDEVSSTFSTI